jgi:ATP-binding cassette, subfamily C, bacterial
MISLIVFGPSRSYSETMSRKVINLNVGEAKSQKARLSNSRSSLLRCLSLFFQAPGSQPVVVLVCLIIAGFAEAFSLGALVPLIAIVDSGDSSQNSQISELARNAFSWIGISMTFNTLIAFIAIAMTLKAVLSFAGLSIAAHARVQLLTHLRLELIRALLAAKWSYFTDQRFGAIANTISTDMMAASMAYIAAARYLANLFQTLALVAVGFLISWQAMLVGIAAALLLMLLLRSFLGRTHISGLKHFKRTATLVALLVDMLNNLKPLKTMSRNEQVAALMTTQSLSAQRARFKQELLKAGLQNAQLAITAILFAAGLYLAVNKLNMPLAGLIGLSVFVFRIVYSFSKSQTLLQTFNENEGGYWRALEFIARAKDAAEKDVGTVTPTINTDCVFENVSFSHGEKQILSNVDLVMPAREITVLQGPSGAGKTTIIDLLTGLHRPTSGRIVIDEVDLNDISLRSWRSMIGYVPQELSLLHATIAENITLGDETIDEKQIWQALEIAGAADFIRDLPKGLSTDVGEMGSRLSGGQRQRIALARAIVRKPKLLIFDEVTSALDPATERDICRRIGSLAGEFTVIAITHRAAWRSIATRLYNVADGNVTKLDSTSALRSSRAP